MRLSDAIGLELERREKLAQNESFDPVAFEYQHEETGVIGYVDKWQIENGFFENNPRLQLTGPLYRHPPQATQQARNKALTAEVEEQARLLGASGSREAELLARVEALEKAARLYLEGAAHSAGCWAYRAMGNNITHRTCVCGHDKLAALLQEPTP